MGTGKVPAEEIIALEQDIFAAIRTRDTEALGKLVDEAFVLRSPGAPDVDKAGFLAAIAQIPGEIMDVRGEDMKVAGTSELAILTGIQIATVRLSSGKVEVDRQIFTDAFRATENGWRMMLAVSVSAPTTK
jgi:hypothetical protein